jgi:hypothetical protein
MNKSPVNTDIIVVIIFNLEVIDFRSAFAGFYRFDSFPSSVGISDFIADL